MNRSQAPLTRRQILRIGATAAAGITLASCGTGSGNTADPVAQTGTGGSTGGGPKTLELWANTGVAGDANSPLAKAVQAFGQANDCTINIQGIATQDLVPKLTTTAASGAGPDIAIVDVSSVPQLAAGQVLADLSDKVSQVQGDFGEQLIAGASYDGKNYGLPYTTNNVALFYNKAMLDRAGIEVPTNWEDLRSSALELTGGDQYGFMMGAQGQGAFLFWPWLWQNGGQILNDDQTKAAFAEAAGLEAFEFYANLAVKDKVVPPEFVASNASWDQYVAPFVQERVAMMTIGPWGIGPITDGAPELDWAVAPLPTHKDAGTVLGGAAIGVGHNAASADLAWEFVKWMTASDQMHYIQDTGNIPGRKEVADSDWANGDPNRKVFIDQVSIARARPALPTWGAIEWGVMADMWDSVIHGQAAPADALQDAAKKADEALSS